MVKKMKTCVRTLVRLVQRVTGIHRIHHIWYGYGWKIPLTDKAYFPSKVSRMRHGFKDVDRDRYHDCTTTGVY